MLLVASLVVFGGLFLGSEANAQSAVPSKISCEYTENGVKKVGIKTSIGIVGDRCVPAGTDFRTNPIVVLLTTILAFMAGGVGLVVVAGITAGGFLYMTARGNSSQTQKAVTTIINSCIGLLLFIFMFAILNFLIPGGVLE